jgi:hypothetical protein
MTTSRTTRSDVNAVQLGVMAVLPTGRHNHRAIRDSRARGKSHQMQRTRTTAVPRAGSCRASLWRPRRAGVAAAACVAIALAAARCGASSSGGHTGARQPANILLAFSICMRAHGVPNFPDPNSQGVVQIAGGTAINPQSPAYQSANSTCQKLQPATRKASPQQQRQYLQRALAIAHCMRAHGVPNFPDANHHGNIGISTDRGLIFNDPAIDQNSPAFETAKQTCERLLR